MCATPPLTPTRDHPSAEACVFFLATVMLRGGGGGGGGGEWGELHLSDWPDKVRGFHDRVMSLR